MKTNDSDISIRNFYGSEDGEQPGDFPYTHGIYPDMYRNRYWTMRQYSGFSSAEESNRRYRYLLDQGVTGLSVAFDLPTQTGYDSDHELADGEVGKVGVPISTLKDMEILLEGIPLEEVSISMTINSTAAILLAFLIAVAEKQKVDPAMLRGTVQNDILKEYIARGTYIYPPNSSMRIVTDIFDYCSKNLPKWNTISISGYHIREAGSTAIQELGFTFANGIAYVQSAIDRGLKVDNFGKRLSFFFNCHMDFFEEIAKFRAARRIWATIMRDRFGATESKAMMCRFHTQTAGSSLTAQQIENNLVRTSLEATAAVLGGTQSLHTNAMDEALALPSEKSAELALRSQQVIAHETGIPNVVDPFAGSWYLESLTDNIEKESMNLIQKIDDLGGAVPAIEMEFQQSEIAQSAFHYQQNLDNNERYIVGVNKFTSEVDPDPALQNIDLESTKQQVNRVKQFKKDRNADTGDKALKELSEIAQTDKNLMPAILNAVKSSCTLGEISDTLRSQFGEHS